MWDKFSWAGLLISPEFNYVAAIIWQFDYS